MLCSFVHVPPVRLFCPCWQHVTPRTLSLTSQGTVLIKGGVRLPAWLAAKHHGTSRRTPRCEPAASQDPTSGCLERAPGVQICSHCHHPAEFRPR